MYTRPTTPRSIGGVLDDAIRLYKASFNAWLVPSVIAAVLSGAAGVWLALHMGLRPTPAQMLALYRSPNVWGSYLLLMLISVWAYCALIDGIVRVAHGGTPSVGEIVNASLAKYPAAFLGTILFLFGTMAGMFLFIVPGIILMGRWMYWLVAMIDQRASALDALSRSWNLSRGHWWRGITIITIAMVIVIVLSMIVSFVVGFGAALGRPDATSMLIGVQVLSAALNVFILPALPAAICAVYFDLQMRREGGDLAGRVGSLKPT